MLRRTETIDGEFVTGFRCRDQCLRTIVLAATVIIGGLFIAPNRELNGQSVEIDRGDGRTTNQWELVLTPADLAVPALQYQLLPRMIDRRPGNAAVWYGKVKSEQNNFFNAEAFRRHHHEWLEMPIEEIRDDETVAQFTRDSTIYDFLERGARSESCDWQLPIRDETFYQILLPEVQETRTFARLLGARARRQIANGDFDGAVRTMQSSFGLARNVSHAPTLINALVGGAIVRITADQLAVMAEQPGAPNMYWAIASLPDPLVNYRYGLDAERDALFLSMPALREMETDEFSEAYWNSVLVRLYEMIVFLSDEPIDELPPMSPDQIRRCAIEAADSSRQRMIDQGGDMAMIDNMSDAQVVLLDSVRRFERQADDLNKWLYFDYPTAIAGLDALAEPEDEDAWLPLSQLLLPSGAVFKSAEVRTIQQLRMLQIIEAIRAYGARNESRLPSSLEEIDFVPIPKDPVTGEPFEYEVTDGKGVLKGGELENYDQVYVIQFESQD